MRHLNYTFDARWTAFCRLWKQLGFEIWSRQRKHHTWCHCGEPDCAGS
jgi:hypothetical protein